MTTAASPSGFRGWLFILAAGVLLTPIITFVRFVADSSETVSALLELLSSKNNLEYMFSFSVVVWSLWLFFASIDLCFVFFSKQERAPKYAIGLIVASFFYVILVTLWTILLLDVPFQRSQLFSLVSTALKLCWVPYLLLSKRVKNTFTAPNQGLIRDILFAGKNISSFKMNEMFFSKLAIDLFSRIFVFGLLTFFLAIWTCLYIFTRQHLIIPETHFLNLFLVCVTFSILFGYFVQIDLLTRGYFTQSYSVIERRIRKLSFWSIFCLVCFVNILFFAHHGFFPEFGVKADLVGFRSLVSIILNLFAQTFGAYFFMFVYIKLFSQIFARLLLEHKA